jgi:hypothetical protein
MPAGYVGGAIGVWDASPTTGTILVAGGYPLTTTMHIYNAATDVWRAGARATSAPGLGPRLQHLHRDWARPCHICYNRTGLTFYTSAPGLGSPPACHICTGTGLTPWLTSAAVWALSGGPRAARAARTAGAVWPPSIAAGCAAQARTCRQRRSSPRALSKATPSTSPAARSARV